MHHFEHLAKLVEYLRQLNQLNVLMQPLNSILSKHVPVENISVWFLWMHYESCCHNEGKKIEEAGTHLIISKIDNLFFFSPYLAYNRCLVNRGKKNRMGEKNSKHQQTLIDIVDDDEACHIFHLAVC